MVESKYNKLAGKHVIILGGSSGIGFTVAEASLEFNAKVTISSSSPEKVEKAVAKLQSSYPGASVQGFACDLSKPTVEQDIEQLFEKTGKVDHIVFTAGDKLATIPVQEATLQNMYTAGQVRFFAAFLTAKVGSKYLNEGPASSITLTTGQVAVSPIANWSVIASFASGLHGMTRNLALDLKPVRVNLVSPGAVLTELWDGMPPDAKEAYLKHVSANALTGTIGKPEDVAHTYLWLMQDKNVTGHIAVSDSGSALT